MIAFQEIKLKNPWWDNSGYEIEEGKMPKRDLYKTVEKNLSHSLILNLVGLRRTGKSTLLKQVTDHLLKNGEKAENIFYFLFDYSVQPQSQEFLDQVLQAYILEKKKVQYPALREKVYILLDEIQYIDNWQAVLKKYYDLSGKNIKFIITGSQSLLLKNKQRESLAGRIFDFYLPPLSFREFLRINQAEAGKAPSIDLYDLPAEFSDLSGFDVWQGPKISSFAKEYIISGQFPETVKIAEMEMRHDYIKNSIIGKILDDCARVYNIEKTDEFKLLAFHLINNASSVYDLANIGREIAVSRLTLEKFVEYLKECFLLEILCKYNKSLIKKGRILKKSYVTSVNFNCALNNYNIDDFNRHPEIFGKIIENAVYNVLRAKFKPEPLRDPLSFWRQGEKEIDFITAKDEKYLPIEVKFSNNIKLKDLAAMIDYVKRKKLEYGVVATRSEIGKKKVDGQTLYYIPYYLLLLMI